MYYQIQVLSSMPLAAETAWIQPGLSTPCYHVFKEQCSNHILECLTPSSPSSPLVSNGSKYMKQPSHIHSGICVPLVQMTNPLIFFIIFQQFQPDT